jgi:predicted nucleotidyltransferase
MIAELAAKRTEIQDICARYPVQRLAVFGSAATGSFNSESSDIDFLLQLQPVTPIQYKRAYFGLLSDLERLLGRSVDLVTESSIQNPYFNLEVQRSKEDIYVR